MARSLDGLVVLEVEPLADADLRGELGEVSQGELRRPAIAHEAQVEVTVGSDPLSPAVAGGGALGRL